MPAISLICGRKNIKSIAYGKNFAKLSAVGFKVGNAILELPVKALNSFCLLMMYCGKFSADVICGKTKNRINPLAYKPEKMSH